MQNVYFISGLGADKRAFQFLDLSYCNPIFIDWINPLPYEDIAHYAKRIRAQIREDEPIIVGLSFGGMVGVELSRLFPVKKLILLSSAKTSNEIPYYLRAMRFVPLHKLFRASSLRFLNKMAYQLMRVEKRKDKVLFQTMFEESQGNFVDWAVDQIIHWKNKDIYTTTIHIHGTADLMLPYRFVKADHIIKGGEHLMVIVKSEMISTILRKLILGGE